MSVITDSIRSKRWVPFARQKLAQIKGMGIPAKTMSVSGYKINLLSTDGVDKVNITAPAVGIATHVEHPADVERLYYAEPYGSGGGSVGPTGNSTDGVYQVVRTTSGSYNDAPGSGVIFPSVSPDFYHKSTGLWAYDGVAQSLAFLETKFAEGAAKDLSAATELIGVGSTSASMGGWQVNIGSAVFAVYFKMDGTNGNTVYVFAYGLNYRSYTILDLDSAEVQGLLGITYPPGKHLNIRGAHLYPYGGKARLALFVAPADPLDNLGGVVFFDFAMGAGRVLSWSYIGRCLTGGLGGDWSTDDPLVKACGPVVTSTAQIWKSCVFADGAGGVISIVRQPGDTSSTDGSYSFTPTAAARTSGLAFPAEVSDPQTWPTIYRGDGVHLCVMEKIYDTGAGTDPLNEIVALYSGGPSAWTALPMPSDVVLAARPIQVGASIVLLALLWDGTGTFMAEFNTVWRKLGRLSSVRMVRPIVGVFGDHAYTQLALNFPGSFPVTSRAGTHNYTGA